MPGIIPELSAGAPEPLRCGAYRGRGVRFKFEVPGFRFALAMRVATLHLKSETWKLKLEIWNLKLPHHGVGGSRAGSGARGDA